MFFLNNSQQGNHPAPNPQGYPANPANQVPNPNQMPFGNLPQAGNYTNPTPRLCPNKGTGLCGNAPQQPYQNIPQNPYPVNRQSQYNIPPASHIQHGINPVSQQGNYPNVVPNNTNPAYQNVYNQNIMPSYNQINYPVNNGYNPPVMLEPTGIAALGCNMKGSVGPGNLSSAYTNSSPTVIWKWLDNDGIFKPYGPRECIIIENAYPFQKTIQVQGNNGRAYYIDFINMLQINEGTGFQRRIIRGE